MTKTPAELLPCPFCGEEAYLSENFIYCGDSISDVYEGGCSNYKCITNKHISYDTKEEVIDKWNARINKEADFLEELKNACNEIIWDTCEKVPSRAEPTLENQFELGKRETARAILKFIEQFQAQQGGNDENK